MEVEPEKTGVEADVEKVADLSEKDPLTSPTIERRLTKSEKIENCISVLLNKNKMLSDQSVFPTYARLAKKNSRHAPLSKLGDYSDYRSSSGYCRNQCKMCAAVLASPKALIHHELEHWKKDNVPKSPSTKVYHSKPRYACSHCGLVFLFPSDLRIHRQKKHSDMILKTPKLYEWQTDATATFDCCHQTFNSLSALVIHKRTHNTESFKRIPRNYCKKVVKSKEVHKEVQKSCDIVPGIVKIEEQPSPSNEQLERPAKNVTHKRPYNFQLKKAKRRKKKAEVHNEDVEMRNESCNFLPGIGIVKTEDSESDSNDEETFELPQERHSEVHRKEIQIKQEVEDSEYPEVNQKETESLEVNQETFDSSEVNQEGSEAKQEESESLNVNQKASETPVVNHEVYESPKVNQEASESPKVNHEASESPEMNHEASESPEMNQEASEPPKVNHEASEPPKVNQEAFESPGVNQQPSEPHKVNQKMAESPEVNQRVSPEVNQELAESPKVNQESSESPEVNQEASGSPKVNQETSESPEVNQELAESPKVNEESELIQIKQEIEDSEYPNANEKVDSPKVNQEKQSECPETNESLGSISKHSDLPSIFQIKHEVGEFDFSEENAELESIPTVKLEYLYPENPQRSRRNLRVDTDFIPNPDVHSLSSAAKFQCIHCHKWFSSLSQMLLHEKSGHHYVSTPESSVTIVREPAAVENGRFNCIHCNLRFGSMGQVMVHEKRRHADSEAKQQKCTNCRKFITTHGVKYPSYCHDCQNNDKQIASTSKVSSVFRCSFCSAVFAKLAWLVVHEIKTHQQEIKESDKKISCDLCDYSFSTPALMAGHKKSDHGIFDIVSTIKMNNRYGCAICWCRFETAEQRNNHMKEKHQNYTFPDNETTPVKVICEVKTRPKRNSKKTLETEDDEPAPSETRHEMVSDSEVKVWSNKTPCRFFAYRKIMEDFFECIECNIVKEKNNYKRSAAWVRIENGELVGDPDKGHFYKCSKYSFLPFT